MSYTSEFPPEFHHVPRWVLQLPVDDISWHNDTCPSFSFRGADPDDETYVRLWVDAKDPDQRECRTTAETRRFTVTVGDGQVVWSSEDESKARIAWSSLAQAHSSGNLSSALASLNSTAENGSRAALLVSKLLEDTKDCWAVKGPSGAQIGQRHADKHRKWLGRHENVSQNWGAQISNHPSVVAAHGGDGDPESTVCLAVERLLRKFKVPRSAWPDVMRFVLDDHGFDTGEGSGFSCWVPSED